MIFDISNQPAPIEPDPLAALKLQSLLEAGSPDNPLRFRTDLALAEVRQARWFRQARRLLKRLDVPAPGTAWPGTLPFAEPISSAHELEAILDGVIEGGLATGVEGTLTLTPAGRALLAEDRAGELYQCLFEHACRQPALKALTAAGPEGEVVAHLFAPILISLGERLRQWTRVEDLPPAMLPGVLWEQLGRTAASRRKWLRLLIAALFNRLLCLGLVEIENGPDRSTLKPADRIRRTALWGRFIEVRPP